MAGELRLFPPFRGAVKWLIVINAAVFILQSISVAFSPRLEVVTVHFLGLSANEVRYGWIWQIVTYSFMHSGTSHILFNMLTLWVFGPGVESAFGKRRFTVFYLLCAAFGAVITVLASVRGSFGMGPSEHSIGASGAVMGVMLAFGLLYANSEIYLIPFPVAFKAKYLVALFMGLDILGLLRQESDTAYFIHLGGAVFAFFYVRFLYRHRGMATAYIGRGLSDGYDERPRAGSTRLPLANPFARLRGAYYRWKRRRAARQFEVYMREHGGGTYVDPLAEDHDPRDKSPQKKNGESREPWVH